MIDTFSYWLFIPLSLPGWLKGIILLALMGGTLLVIMQWAKRRQPALLNLLLLFIPIYIVLLLLSISFFDANTPLDQRILSPVYVAGLAIFLFAGHTLWMQGQPQRFIRPVLVGGGVFFFTAHILQSTPWLVRASQEGLGFHHVAWQRSSLMTEVKALPDEVVVYANTPDVVYFLTGRLAHSLPRKIDRVRRRPNDDYPLEMAALGAHATREPLAIILTAVGRANAPTEVELQATLPLQPIFEAPEGALYLTNKLGAP